MENNIMRNGFARGVLAGCMMILFTVPLYAQDQIWSVNYGGTYNEEAYAGAIADDGGYAVIGNVFLNGNGSYNFYLLKLNSVGDTLWTRDYGGDSAEYGYDLKKLGDGGYILVGSTRSYGNGGKDIYVVRTDSLGDTLWTRTIGGSGDDYGRAVALASGGGFVICGTTDSYGFGYTDMYVVRLDANGNLLSSRPFGGTAGDVGAAVIRTTDNGFLAVGSTGSFGSGYSSVYAVRLSAAGDSLWARTYGGSSADFGRAAVNAIDGGFVLAGRTASYGAGFYDAYIVKIDADGNFVWENTFGTSSDDYAHSIMAAMDGTYMISGFSEVSPSRKYDAYVVKADVAGGRIWERSYGGDQADYGNAIVQDQGQDYVLIGHTYSFSYGGSDIYVTKIMGEATDSPDDWSENLPYQYKLHQNYPNPFNAGTRISFDLPRRADITLAVYNILGQRIRDWTLQDYPAGSHYIDWDGRDGYGRGVSSGVYLYRLTAGTESFTRKMVLVK